MDSSEIARAARQIALPTVGLDGQARIAAATAAIVGDDLACEVVARALSAAGLGRLRLIRRSGTLPGSVGQALLASNPGVAIETLAWPRGTTPQSSRDDLGPAWLNALTGVSVIVRSGFDDDPMLRAAVRLAVPVVAMRGRAHGIDVVSFRRHGPCPHATLDVPEKQGAPSENGAAAVVAAHLAAAEVLNVLAGSITGAARARHVGIPALGALPRAVDIPWSPECFACGGTATEMSFA